MIDFLGVSDLCALVRRVGTGRFIERLAAEIEADYARWSGFDHCARLASHSSRGVIELMPATDGRLYAFKYVNGHPGNTRSGRLTVAAFGVLSEVDTGYPVLLAELTLTTALRTAAMSALAARWMARPGVRTMALIGNGAQSEFQALAFHRLLGVEHVRLHDVDPEASAKLARNLAAMPETAALTVTRCASTAEAVEGADVVTTVTADKRNAVILTPSMVRPGMHLNAVGGDCPGKTELDPEILRRADARVVVEYAPQSRIEGEVQQLAPDFPVIEFAALVSGSAVARRSDADVTIFDSVGFALEDFAALRFLHALLAEHPDLRRGIDLVPDPDDPKDLFGGLLEHDAGACERPMRPARPLRRVA